MCKNFNFESYVNLLTKHSLDETEQYQLLVYSSLVERQITCNRRLDYLLLIDEYLAKKISANVLQANFLEMQGQDSETTQIMRDDIEKLRNFSIDSELTKNPFSVLIDLIYYSSVLAIEFGPEEGISDEKFELCIRSALARFFDQQ